MAIDDQELLIRINAATESLERSLGKADGTIDRFERNVNRATRRVEQRFDRMGRAVERTMRGLVPALSGAAFVAGTRRAIEYGDSIGVVSERLGVSAEFLQEWRFAAEESSNLLAGPADVALQRFIRRLGEAQQGYGVLLRDLEDYDVALRDNEGNLRSGVEVYLDWAEAVANAGTRQEQLRAAVAAFDTEGGVLVNLVDEGADGFIRYAEAAREAGVLTSQQVAEAQELDSQLTQLSLTMNTNLTQAFISLGPILQGFVSGLAATARFVGQTVDAIDSLLAEFSLSTGPTLNNAELQSFLTDLETRGLDAQAIGGSARQSLLRAFQRQSPAFEEAFEVGNVAEMIRLTQELLAQRQALQDLTAPTIEPFGAAGGGGGAGDDPTEVLRTLGAQTQAFELRRAALLQLTPTEQRYAEVLGELNRNFVEAGGVLDSDALALNQEVAFGFVEAERVFNDTAQAAELVREAIGSLPPSANVAGQASDMLARELARLGIEGERAALATANLEVALGGDLADDMSNLGAIGQQVGSSFESAFDSAIFKGEELSEVLKGLALDLARLVLRQGVLEPIGGGIGDFIADLFHSGGVVGQGAPGRAVSPLAFVGAPRLHSGGILPNEVPAILQRGEEVLSRSDPRNVLNGGGGGGGGGGITIHQSISIDAQAVNQNGIDPASADAVGRQMRQAVRSAVQQEIAQQSRVGGLLNRV
ncbi:MAG: hypothetical protein AAFX92_06165 [Pseudomonadota bacterium]